MTIRPIDMQVLIPKSQNVSKINQTIVNKDENIVQQAFIQNKELETKKLKKINTLDKKDDPIVKNDPNRNKGKSSSKKKKEQNSKNSSKSSSKSHTIDIKI